MSSDMTKWSEVPNGWRGDTEHLSGWSKETSPEDKDRDLLGQEYASENWLSE